MTCPVMRVKIVPPSPLPRPTSPATEPTIDVGNRSLVIVIRFVFQESCKLRRYNRVTIYDQYLTLIHFVRSPKTIRVAHIHAHRFTTHMPYDISGLEHAGAHRFCAHDANLCRKSGWKPSYWKIRVERIQLDRLRSDPERK